jgi:3'(2'), 5'-bisphosphate nucleotidase
VTGRDGVPGGPPAEALLELVERAGAAILGQRERGLGAREKADRSMVTRADEAAEAIIVEGLVALAPAIPIVAEERVAAGVVPDISGGRFWLVDPLDGTRELLDGSDEFTVNIALIEDRRPVLGVVGAPATGTVWWGAAGQGAFRARAGASRPIRARARPAAGPVAVASRSHMDDDTRAFLAREGVTDYRAAGSSLKFCLIAEGLADLYPRFGPTMEWDTAAGDAVLRAAGGRVTTPDGTPFLYGKPGFRNGPFVARGAL